MALSEIEKLERRYAENPQGLTFAPLAEVHRKNGDVTRALDLLRSGLSLHPDYIPASIVLGRCHLDLGDLPAAETAFTHVLSLDGENVIALKALADVTERQGRFDEAERWLRTLIAVDRSNDDARDQLGRVEATRRQTAGAAVVAEGKAAVAEETTAADGVASADAVVSEGASGDAVTAETSTAAGSPPVSEPVTGWVTESGSAEAAEVVPLDLEDLGAGIELESSPLEGIQVEQPTSLGDTVEPIAGLVGRDDHVDLGSFDHVTDFRVETAEDIILNSSGGSEFQVANAAEELLGIGDRHEPAPSLLDAAPDLEPTSGASVDEHAGEGAPSAASDDGLTPIAMDGAERTMFEAVPPAGPEPAPEEPITAEANVPDWALEPLSIEDDRPAEPASTSAEWTPPWSRQREPEPAPVPEPVTVPEPTAGSEPAPSAPEPWASPAAEPPREAEPDLVVTASMAELLLQQGHAVEALTVYRLLETRAGGASRYGEKIAELERLTALPETPAAPPQPVAPTPAYSVLETKGQSVQAFLRTVLTARPAAVAPSAAVHAAPSRGGPASAQGAPTRPAHDSLSLSSVFGEESTPTLPAVPAASSGAPPAGVSYDEFFGGGGNPAAPRQPRAPDSKSDDLDQFHAWLQNLKR